MANGIAGGFQQYIRYHFLRHSGVLLPRLFVSAPAQRRPQHHADDDEAGDLRTTVPQKIAVPISKTKCMPEPVEARTVLTLSNIVRITQSKPRPDKEGCRHPAGRVPQPPKGPLC